MTQQEYDNDTTITILTGHTSVIRDAHFSPDGTKVMSGSDDKTVKIFDIKTGEILLDFKEHTKTVRSVYYHPYLSLGVSGGSDNTVKVWNTITGEVIYDFQLHTSTVYTVQFSPDGQFVLSASSDGVYIWDSLTGEVLTKLSGSRIGAFSPDGSMVATGTAGGLVNIYDVKTAEKIYTLTPHTARVTTVAFSPDNTTIMSGSNDKTVKITDIATNTVILDFTAHTDTVHSVNFSEDGRYGISSGGLNDKTVKVFNIETGEILLDYMYNHWVYPSEFSPDMKMGLCAGGRNNIHIFSLEDVLFDPNRYLYRKDNTIYQITPNEIIETPTQELTKELFEEYGVTNILLFDTVKHEGEILISRDIEREGVPKAYIKGYSSPQLIKASGDIRLSRISKINDITLKHKDPKQKIRVIYSLDSGETWLTKTITDNIVTTSIIDSNNLQEVAQEGMDLITFNQINTHWTEEVVSYGKIRFGYFFDIDNADDTSYLSELSINMNSYGSWKSQRHKTNHRKEYTNNELIVIFYQDGTYKINYES